MDKALTGYLMARAALHRKIDNTPDMRWNADGSMEKQADALKRLQAANETVAETHVLLPYGRGNVKEDNIRTHYESSLRDSCFDEFMQPTPLTRDPYQRLAGAFRFVKAARCTGSSVIATHLHARKLEDPYRVITCGDPEADHTWSEVKWTDKRRGNDVIMDRWCDGPAVLREDAQYGYQHAMVLYRLNTHNGPKAARTVDEITASLEGDERNKQRLDKILEGLDSHRRTTREYAAKRVFSSKFESEAGQVLKGNSGRPHLAQEIQAVGVALSLNGGPDLTALERGHSSVASTSSGKVREALAQAPGILASAQGWFPPRNR